MKLQEEIKQKEFKNEYQKLAVNLIYTYSWLMSHQNRLLSKFDITTQQFNILRILRGQYPSPASVNLLKDRMLDKMSDASRLVERLRVKGLVERERSKVDRRKVEVKITERGLNILSQMDIMEDQIENLFRHISEEDAEVVNNILDKLRG